MLRIAKLTDYATGLMARLARVPGCQLSAQAMSREMDLPLPTVAMLLKRLARAGLVQSSRGAGGGYGLARAPDAISVAEVIVAIEGPVALTECALGVGRCSVEAELHHAGQLATHQPRRSGRARIGEPGRHGGTGNAQAEIPGDFPATHRERSEHGQ